MRPAHGENLETPLPGPRGIEACGASGELVVHAGQLAGERTGRRELAFSVTDLACRYEQRRAGASEVVADQNRGDHGDGGRCR